jgi:hypothetical protein
MESDSQDPLQTQSRLSEKKFSYNHTAKLTGIKLATSVPR